MTPNPILRVLSTFEKNDVKSLLIGGQACIIYGAAEFSRDSDFVVLSDLRNIEKLEKALKELKAEPIYVPPLKIEYLDRGHACHFRCFAKGVEKLRVDILSKLRGCDSFNELWRRKNRIRLKDGGNINVIGLWDLVQSKKTQRDKDWLMLKRLVENDIILNKTKPSLSPEHVKRWLLQCRTPQTLIELSQKYPEIVQECLSVRPLLSAAIDSNAILLEEELRQEELLERKKDFKYWLPLKEELEILRRRNVKE